MLENIPGKHLKVLVLEGSMRLSMKGTFGDSLLLLPGKMVIMPPNARRIPDPVSVDLAHVMKTSGLVKMDKTDKPLPSASLIQTEIATQEKSKASNTLVDTNLVILGSGTKVVAASDDVIDALGRKDGLNDVLLALNGSSPTPISTPAATPVPTATPLPTAAPSPSVGPGGSPTPPPDDDETGPSPTPGVGTRSVSSSNDLTISQPIWTGALTMNAGKNLNVAAWIAANSVTFVAGKTATISAGIYAHTLVGTAKDLKIERSLHVQSTTLNVEKTLTLSAPLLARARAGSAFFAPADGRELTLHVRCLDLELLAGDVAPITLNGGNAAFFSLFEGGSGGTLNIGDSASPVTGGITISAPLFATSGRNGFLTTFGGDGGTVNAVANGTIAVNSTIKVSDKALGHASKSGGSISLESRKTGGTAINISSSAQLLSLLANAAPGAGGSIKFTSAGGTINMSGTAKADRGSIDIRNNGNNGIVNLANATLHGDVVKAGVLGSNGTLNVGGGTINADSTIYLYAAGSNGTVNFTDNVTLSGTSVKTISGHTVTVRNGRVVTVLGPEANVFTDHPNYTGSGGNNSTTGTFGGAGATTQPLSASPGG